LFDCVTNISLAWRLGDYLDSMEEVKIPFT